MSYKLYLDKNNTFECDIQLQGASINNSFARVILESKDISYVFNGTIDENGHCSIEINKLKNLFKNNDVGGMKLEIIAEDVYFNPWNSEFSVDQSKKAEVIIKEQKEETKPSISVNVKTPPQKEIIETSSPKDITKQSEVVNGGKDIIKEQKNPIVNKETKKDVSEDSNKNTFTMYDLKRILNQK